MVLLAGKEMCLSKGNVQSCMIAIFSAEFKKVRPDVGL